MGLPFLKLTHSHDRFNTKSFGQRLFSRSGLSPSSSDAVFALGSEKEHSSRVQSALLPSGNKDHFVDCHPPSSSPPPYQDLQTVLPDFASQEVCSSTASAASTYSFLGTGDMANTDGECDSDFLRAVLSYGDSETAISAPSSLADKRRSVHGSQAAQPHSERPLGGRLFSSQLSEASYRRSDFLPRSHAVPNQTGPQTSFDEAESDSEDEYGCEETDQLASHLQTDQGKSLSTSSTTQDRTPVTSNPTSHRIRTAIELDSPCQRALYVCTLLKIHVQLSSILATDPDWRLKMQILTKEGRLYSTEKLNFPRSVNLASKLHQHVSTHGFTRDLRVALARSAIMRKLRSKALTKAEHEELSYFPPRYGSDLVTSDHISSAIQEVKMSQAEALVTLPFSEAAKSSVLELNNSKKTIQRLGFKQRTEETIFAMTDHQQQQPSLDSRNATSRDQVSTTATLRSHRLAPWLVPKYSRHTLHQPATSITQSGIQKAEKISRDQEQHVEAAMSLRHRPHMVEHRNKTYPGLFDAKRNDNERKAAAEVDKLNKSRQALQDARDRRASTRQSILLAEPNYGAGNPLLNRSLPRKESALDITSARSNDSTFNSRANFALPSKHGRSMYLQPEGHRLRTSSFTPPRVSAPKASPIIHGMALPRLQDGASAFAPVRSNHQIGGMLAPAESWTSNNQLEWSRQRTSSVQYPATPRPNAWPMGFVVHTPPQPARLPSGMPVSQPWLHQPHMHM